MFAPAFQIEHEQGEKKTNKTKNTTLFWMKQIMNKYFAPTEEVFTL